MSKRLFFVIKKDESKARIVAAESAECACKVSLYKNAVAILISHKEFHEGACFSKAAIAKLKAARKLLWAQNYN